LKKKKMTAYKEQALTLIMHEAHSNQDVFLKKMKNYKLLTLINDGE